MGVQIRVGGIWRKILKNPFIGGSFVMVVGTNLYSVGQFIYHSLSLRLLNRVHGDVVGTSYYGDLASVISLLGMIGVAQIGVGLTVVRFVASETDKKKVANLVKWLDWWSVLGGMLMGILFLVFSVPIARFLNISQPFALLIFSPAIFLFVVTNTSRSVLQGMLKFKEYVLSLLVEIFPKLLLSVLFILLGFALYGMMAALLIGFVIMFFVTRSFISSYLRGSKMERPDVKPLIYYSLPIFVKGITLTSLYSTDIILVKHFFSPEKAGVYAFLAVLGRVAFFASSPIASVMFPMVARKHSRGEGYQKIFLLSAVFVVLVSTFVILFYRLFPGFVVNVFSGSSFEGSASILWWFALSMGLLSLATLLIQFYLSIGRTRVVGLYAFAAVLQAVLIWFNHPNILTVVQISVLSLVLSTVSLLVYFPYHKDE